MVRFGYLRLGSRPPQRVALAIHFKQARTREKDEYDFSKQPANADDKTKRMKKYER